MAIDLDVHGNTKPLEAAVQAAINRIRRQPIKITVDDKGATQPLGNMKRAADEFSKSMEAANARILAFGASMAIINGVADAFKGMVRNLVEVEKSLADINVVMGLSTQNLDKFGDGLFKVAKETGAAFRVAADAATEYARQGLAVEETLKRTRDALVLTRLTGMDSAEAVKSLTAAMNTYGNQIKDTTQLVSKFAAVDVQFAVSAEDFAAAISRTGQAAKSAGVDIDELIGIVTSAQQQTARGGAVIGNALKTIFTKTGRTDTLNQLENLGIAVRDLEGNTIGAKRILTDLANTFDTLSEAQKAQITQTMGGLFHINILKAVLSDAAKQNGILANATQISANATDEAIQKNEQLRATMAAMAGETGNAIKQLSVQIGELMLAPGMEKILNTVKSLAEGASDILGDGESAGNQFANGFLKGLGNVITGPGLVVLTTVFVKLFMTAAKFTKESLSSLIGVTSEAQKQKAIQTSLVALIGQNAALGKEMLRTDISRTEKEKILLGLLRMQTAEAENLNRISKQLASTLYTKGYGPGLTTGKRRAYGHIPNFADPERSQAARGGYAAGSIRSMNMPGEGSVIYNSAETVKNFAGFKQPAIMPPQSSKAGKNYQQAFGSIHGFDPYAAGGYIPNFNKAQFVPSDFMNAGTFRKMAGVSSTDSKNPRAINAYDQLQKYAAQNPSLQGLTPTKLIASYSSRQGTLAKNAPASGLQNIPLDLNQIPLTKQKIKDMGVLLGYGKEGPTEPITYSQSFGSLPKEVRSKLLPYMKSIRGKEYGLKKMPDKNSDHWKRKVTATLPTKAVYAVSEDDAERMEKAVGADTLKAALKRSIGPGFDRFSSKIGQKLFGSKSKKSGINVLEEHVLSDGSALGALFEAGVRGALNNKALTGAEQQRAFDFMGDNAQRLSENFMGIGKRRFIEAKKDLNAARLGDIPKKVLNAAAKGFIPNFADPLSDAIGREKAAGVPVSQIRVGSHSALMNKGNPLGLGVTNTHDEPNGLRDVFGANGFVPNYAFNLRSDFQAGRDEYKAAAELQKEINKENKKLLAEKRKLSLETNRSEDTEKRLTAITKQLTKNKQDFSAATKMAADATKKMSLAGRAGGAIQNISNINQRFSEGVIGRGLSGGGGMGLMIGAPMLAGFLQSGGAAEGGFGYKAGGALMGAGTGASIGMMFGPIGIAVGGVVGAFAGLVGAIDENKEALKEASKARGEYAGRLGQQLGAQLQPVPGVGKVIADKKGLFSHAERRITEFEGYSSKRGSVQQKNKEGIKAIEDAQAALSSEILNEVFSSLPEGYKFEAQEIISKEERKKLGESYQPMTKLYSAEEYTEELKGLSPEERTAYVKRFISAQEDATNRQEEVRKGIIKQLNMQRVMLSSQRAAADAQFEIKKSYMQITDSLQIEEKTMGHLMTEEQKARLKHAQAINKSTETYKLAESAAEQAFKSGILQQIESGSNKDVLQAELKKILKGENITEQVAGMSPKELLDTLNKIKIESGETSSITRIINQLIKNQIDLRDNTLSRAKQQQELSNSQADTDLKINSILGKRNDTLKLLNTQMAEYIRQSEHAVEIGRIQQDIEKTRFGAPGMGYKGIYRTPEEIIAFERKQLKERPTSFASSQVKTAQQSIDELKMTGIDPRDLIKEGKFNKEALRISMQSNLDSQINDPSERIALLRSSIEKRTADIKEYNKKADPRSFLSKTHEERMQDSEISKNLMLQQNAELQELRQLEEQEKQRERVQEKINDTIRTLGDAEEQEGKITEQLKEQIDARERLLKYKRGEALPGDTRSGFQRGIDESRAKMANDVREMDFELGYNIPRSFADGMANAMTEALNGTKNIKEALTDAAISFLGMIQEAMMKKMVYQMVGLPFSQGGNVRNYSRGGGVPAMVSNGEYVMGRDAVAKYGGAFMHGLNAGGKIPGFSNGGAPGSALAANFGGGRGYASGRAYQSRAMSSFFYRQSGNVGLAEDTSTLQGILAEEERKRQEAEARRQAKKAKRRQLLGMAASVGLMWGLGGGFKDLFKSKITAPEGMITTLTRFNGGPIRKYAGGGYISGKSGIDQIPAMLSEGEYVIRASSARQIGKPMLDRINAGKFNEGGAVSELMGSSETASSGGNTNNINISINMERGSGSKRENQSQDNSGQNPADRSSDEQNNAALAERIKQQVVAVIVEEQRPGGLLSE